MRPVRLQLSRTRGFDLQALSRQANGLPARRVTRPGPWGNPFAVTAERSQAEAVALCATYLRDLAARDPGHFEALRGHNLACWCAAGTPCHADLLIELANPT
jgi:hypothetical protein